MALEFRPEVDICGRAEIHDTELLAECALVTGVNGRGFCLSIETRLLLVDGLILCELYADEVCIASGADPRLAKSTVSTPLCSKATTLTPSLMSIDTCLLLSSFTLEFLLLLANRRFKGDGGAAADCSFALCDKVSARGAILESTFRPLLVAKIDSRL